ncbi:MFS general substrate transporter [Byssothecium circinans]|uniref:MFS general substrate transporter n=1 Tax=Byssothecium circinans TaxID=147558 RepID=A0A6A5T7G1_9PLEO|nr:MFS general substrate transporter [Byssothecium circinans]
MAEPTPSITTSLSAVPQTNHTSDIELLNHVALESSNPTDVTAVQAEPRGGAAAKRSQLQTAILMGTLCSAVFLDALDVTIVATAFSDIWGRRPILMIAVAIFFLGSALCGAAVNMTMLIIARVVQGLAAGGLLSLVSITIGDLERGKYYGIVGMVWAMAFTLGPLIGGALTKGASWRWCFYINLPISGAAFILVTFLLKLETPKTPLVTGLQAVDWTGSLVLVGGSSMLLLGLQFGGTVHPWNSATVICLIVFGVVTIIFFFAVERYFARYPIVPVHLYTDATNLAIIMVNLFHGITFTQNTYFLPLYCQAVLEASALMSGVLLLPFSVSMSIATVGSGLYIKKTGRYLDCIRGGFIPLSKIILYQIIPGFGEGLNFQPLLIALQCNIPPQDNAAATASFGLVRNVASAMGVVIGGVAFSNKMNEQKDRLTQALGAGTADLYSGSNAQANVIRIRNLPASQQEIVRLTFWSSMRSIWIVAVAFSRLPHYKTHVEVKTGLAGEEERRKFAIEQRAAKVKKPQD